MPEWEKTTVDVCIVTPGHLSSNPRVYKEASALHNAGFSVEVVHGSYAPFYEEQDSRLARGFATKAVRFGPYVSSRPNYWKQTVLRRAAKLAARTGYTPFFVAKHAISPVARDLALAACSTQARLYIGHYVASLPAVSLAAAKYESRYSFDAEDFHLGDLPETAEHAVERKIIEKIERQTLPKAVLLTAASPGISESYAGAYGLEKPVVILNVFPRETAPPKPTMRGDIRPGPSVYWFSQTIGPGRGLEAAVAAVCNTKSKAHLYLRGAVHQRYRNILEALAGKAGGLERIHFLPLIAPEELERAGAAFDVGYVGETEETLNRSVCLTNKIFSYLSSGLPMVLSDTYAHKSFAPRLGQAAKLFKARDPHELSRVIDEFLCDVDGLATARAAAYQLGVNRFNWDVESQKLVRAISLALR